MDTIRDLIQRARAGIRSALSIIILVIFMYAPWLGLFLARFFPVFTFSAFTQGRYDDSSR